MRRAAGLLLACAALAGCGGGDDGGSPRDAGSAREGGSPRDGGSARDGGSPAAPPAEAAPRAGEPPQARQIRAWSIANNRGQFGRAASYFAPGAIVEQLDEVRLPDRAAAIAFNRSLPCRAQVTDVAEDGDSIVAAFRLSPGRGGAQSCGGSARVRFRFEGDRFTEWRQLAEPAAPEGPIV